MEIVDHKIDIDGSTIYYRTAGDSKNGTLVFLHGWPGIKLVESGVIQALAKYFYVICPEHPGLGRSDPLLTYTNIFEQYADIAHKVLVNEKRHKEKSIIMGQSFGGGVASAYAYKYPNFTKCLILVDSTVGAGPKSSWMIFLLDNGPRVLKIFPYLPKPLKKLVLKYVFATLEGDGISWKHIDKSIPKRIVMVDKYVSLVRNYIRQNKGIIDKEYGEFPIVMAWGDRDGKEFNLYGSCNVDYAKELYEKMKKEGRNIKFVEVKGGHTILYEKPKYVISEIFNSLKH